MHKFTEDIYLVEWAGGQAAVTLPEHIGISNAGQVREELLPAAAPGTAPRHSRRTCGCSTRSSPACLRWNSACRLPWASPRIQPGSARGKPSTISPASSGRSALSYPLPAASQLRPAHPCGDCPKAGALGADRLRRGPDLTASGRLGAACPGTASGEPVRRPGRGWRDLRADETVALGAVPLMHLRRDDPGGIRCQVSGAAVQLATRRRRRKASSLR